MVNSFFDPPLADPAYWAGKRVVVTGGAGFIGSHVVERLLPLCGHVAVPTRQLGQPRHLAHLAPNVQLLRGDLRDAEFAERALRGCDVLLCLAAVVGGIHYNMEHHASILRDNLQVFLTTMEAARLSGVGRVLVTSSACVYPRDCRIPTPEQDGFAGRPEPTNEGYGWAKRMEEYLAQAYAREFGMSVAVARPYNAYGPRDNFDPAASHVIPALIRKALEPGDTLTVWGSGRQSRSFLYVSDFVDGLIRICERAADAEPTNLGADEETTVGELVEHLLRLSGSSKRVVFDASRPEGQPRRHCDTTRLERVYAFRARVPLVDGLARTVDYYREEVACRST
ncbi:MAG: NAD-dependent epimerase/dehydratase family protein [Candidatus Eremiobacterota bacterium]